MTSIVFGALGGLLGPVGAAVGSLAGSILDRTVVTGRVERGGAELVVGRGAYGQTFGHAGGGIAEAVTRVPGSSAW